MRIYNRRNLNNQSSNKPRFIWLVAILLVLISSVFANTPCYATEADSSIIKEALDGIVCDRNLAVMIEGAYFQSTKLNKAKIKPERHFESQDLEKSFRYIKSERRKVLNSALLAGPEPQMRTRCLFHFGMMLHTINNFYTNTNYLPEKISQLRAKHGKVNDPYNIDLVDWSTETEAPIQSLKWIAKKNRKKIFANPLNDTTVARVARGLAIRETRRQWDFLEALIRSRYCKKADTIIAALKQAGCDQLIPEELDGIPLHAHAKN